MTITTNNYEDWLYQYCEGLLDDEQRAAVEAWLAEHPEAAEEAALYDSELRLTPTAETCPDKEILMRHEPQRVALWRWAAAACVAALLTAGVWLLWPESENDTPVVAEQRTEAQAVPETPSVMPIEVATAQNEMPLRAAVQRSAMRTESETSQPEIQSEETVELLETLVPDEVPSPTLLADAAPVANDTVVIYIDSILQAEEPVEIITETYLVNVTTADKLRAFRRRCITLISDYSYRAYSEARATLLAWASIQEENINQLKQS